MLLFYFYGSFYFESLNLVRQFIAMAIILSSYKLLLTDKKRDKIFWIICVIIASMFHTISLVFCIMIFFNKKIINYKVIIILSIVVALFGGKIPSAIANVINTTNLSTFTNFDKYVQYADFSGDLPMTTIIVEIMVYLFVYKLYYNAIKNGLKVEREGIFFVNVQSMAILSTVMNIHIELFFRIALLFSIFQILSIPYFYNLNKDNYLMIFEYKIKKGAILFTIIIVLIMSAKMIYSNVIKGADEVLPYKTIFTEKRKV